MSGCKKLHVLLVLAYLFADCVAESRRIVDVTLEIRFIHFSAIPCDDSGIVIRIDYRESPTATWTFVDTVNTTGRHSLRPITLQANCTSEGLQFRLLQNGITCPCWQVNQFTVTTRVGSTQMFQFISNTTDIDSITCCLGGKPSLRIGFPFCHGFGTSPVGVITNVLYFNESGSGVPCPGMDKISTSLDDCEVEPEEYV